MTEPTTPFTVKWEYRVDGIQRSRIIEADQVNVAYDERPDPGAEGLPAKLGIYQVGPHGCVVIGNPENGAESMALTFGKVYVMNREGKTVSTYTLGEPPQTGRQPAGADADKAKGLYGEPKSLAHLAQEAGLRQKSHY